MKKTIVYIILAGIMIMSISAQVRTTPDLQFRNGTQWNLYPLEQNFVNQDPDPAEPGQYADLRWKIENIGESIAEDVVVELLPEYPFILDSNEDPIRDIGTMQAGQTGKEGVIVKYKVRVDKNAVEGKNEIKIRYKSGNHEWITETFYIRVRTRDASLNIDKVETTPEKLVPGGKAHVKVYLTNIADSVIKDVTLKLDLGLSTIELPQTLTIPTGQLLSDLIPFAPINSATEKKIRFANPGEQIVFDYDIIVYPDAEARVYKVPIQLKFYDELNNETVKNDIIGLSVGDEPELELVIEKQDVYQTGQRGEVLVKIVNKGTNNVKFMNVDILPSDSYELFGPGSVYLGKIDSDDYESFDIDMYAKKSENSELNVPLHVTFRDNNNNQFAKDVMLTVPMYNSQEVKKYGLTQGSPVVGIIIILVIVAGGIYGYKKYRKKGKKKEKK